MDEPRLSALEAALLNEKKEREFYLFHAERTKNPIGKGMFLAIAADETEHMVRLQKIHERWRSGGSWPEGELGGLAAGKVREHLLSLLGGAVPQDAHTDADDVDALKKACAFEAQGAKAYADLAGRSADARERAFFELLSSMEREHYLSLKETLEYLEDPAGFFARKERHGLDGA